MSNKDYNWADDPWNEEKQAADEEELRHAGRMGLIAVVVLVVIVLMVLFAGPFVTLLAIGYGAGAYF